VYTCVIFMVCLLSLTDRIVGFYVEPLSVKHVFSSPWNGNGDAPALSTCSSTKHLDYDSIKEKQKVLPGQVVFTYGVEWRQSDVSNVFRFVLCMYAGHFKIVSLPRKILFKNNDLNCQCYPFFRCFKTILVQIGIFRSSGPPDGMCTCR
jgi:hypothetical protein